MIMRLTQYLLAIAVAALTATASASAQAVERYSVDITELIEVPAVATAPDTIDMAAVLAVEPYTSKPAPISIYELPYSMTTRSYDWKRLWINTGVLSGAFVGTLVVLECLPEDATSWNRAELQKDPWYRRWYQNVCVKGPEWDHDNAIFNYVLHPYAGAAYFMAARSNGFNFYQSLLYSACVSTIGWEFGIEACMERPSIQDIFITPLVGSAIGEMFYKLKRHIVYNDYRLFGSPVLGNIVAFLIDPVNEVIGLFDGNPARKLHLGRKQPQVVSTLMPTIGRGSAGFAFTCVF